MNDVVPAPTLEIAAFDPAGAALRAHVAQKQEEVAIRAKNVEAVTAAVRDAIEAERDFALSYRAQFQHGGDHKSGQYQDARTGVLIDPSVWCESYGFSLRTVQRWCEKLIDGIDEEFAERLVKVIAIIRMAQAANFLSESVEWYTPAPYLEAARAVMGGIDLDPASNAEANKRVKAKEFYTDEQDGLTQTWFGRVFLNPPYGKTKEHRSLAAEFCNRALADFKDGQIQACTILVNSVHSQSWQAPLYDYPVCFVDHRIQFVSGDGETNKNPTFQNIFVYLGQAEARFAHEFRQFGYVMKRMA